MADKTKVEISKYFSKSTCGVFVNVICQTCLKVNPVAMVTSSVEAQTRRRFASYVFLMDNTTAGFLKLNFWIQKNLKHEPVPVHIFLVTIVTEAQTHFSAAEVHIY